MKTEDEILQQIDRDLVVGFTKDDSPDRFKALDRLCAFGLVYEQPKYQWRLTDKGYKAVSVGFDKWLINHDKPTSFVTSDNVSFITVDGNNVNQSRFDNLRDTNIKQTAKPIEYENKQNAIISWWQKFWWQALIPFIIGLIILGLDKGWFGV